MLDEASRNMLPPPPTPGPNDPQRDTCREWLAAYAERVGEIPPPPPEVFGTRLAELHGGNESALAELCSASLTIALDVARDMWEANPTRAIWEVVAEANSVITLAVRGFFGASWSEFQNHLRTAVRLKLH